MLHSGAEAEAQWKSICLACTRPWFSSLAPPKISKYATSQNPISIMENEILPQDFILYYILRKFIEFVLKF